MELYGLYYQTVLYPGFFFQITYLFTVMIACVLFAKFVAYSLEKNLF